MNNQKVKGNFTLDPNFGNRWRYFMGFLMGLWWVIFKFGEKYLSKLPPPLYGVIHFLRFLNVSNCNKSNYTF